MSREQRVFGIGLLGDLNRVTPMATTFERLSGKAVAERGVARSVRPLIANAGAFSAR